MGHLENHGRLMKEFHSGKFLLSFDGKLDFSVLSSDVTVYDDTTEQQLTERMQGADEDAGIWKAQFEDEHWKIWRSFCIIFTNLT